MLIITTPFEKMLKFSYYILSTIPFSNLCSLSQTAAFWSSLVLKSTEPKNPEVFRFLVLVLFYSFIT